MKKTFLKFSKSLLSNEETKTIKGGYDDTPGGGGTGGHSYVVCGDSCCYPPERWFGFAGCPTVANATSFCQSQGMYYISKTC